jgi:phosphate starvation-inducible PhoH-like protein
MVAIEEDMGYLPGNIKDKMHPWTIPVFDIFEEYYSKKELNSLVAENKIEIAPLGFMQGRTFKNSIIIADEMQNSTPNQMFMLLTRLGLNSKMIVTGDLMQTNDKNNGLSNIIQKLDNHYDEK